MKDWNKLQKMSELGFRSELSYDIYMSNEEERIATLKDYRFKVYSCLLVCSGIVISMLSNV